MSDDIVHDLDLCNCFDCRTSRRVAAEQARLEAQQEERARRDREAYIKRRGGEPYVSNRKLP